MKRTLLWKRARRGKHYQVLLLDIQCTPIYRDEVHTGTHYLTTPKFYK